MTGRPGWTAALLAVGALTVSACQASDDAADSTTDPPTTASSADDDAQPGSAAPSTSPAPTTTVPTRPVTDDEIVAHLAGLPAMPVDVIGLLQLGLVDPAAVTFGSGTPFNDLPYTLLDTDYIEGETSGYDTYMPVDPSDELPGANSVKVVHAVSNPQIDAAYQSARGDRIILGDGRGPFFRSPGDGTDDDWVSIVDFDPAFGHVELPGSPDDYDLRYAAAGDTTGAVVTDGWYLTHLDPTAERSADRVDLIAWFAPCGDRPTPCADDDPLPLGPGSLALDDPVQFRFVEPLPDTPAVDGLVQDGTAGNELVTGVTVDADGNVYLVGSGDGDLDGAGPSGTVAGADTGNELFVVSYDRDGERRWVSELAVPEGGLLFDAVADGEHLYAVGRMFGALDGFTSGGVWDGIIVKLDLASGEIVDTDQWGNGGIDGYGAVALDDAGNLYVSGAGSPPGATADPEGTGAGDPAFVLAKHSTDTLDNVWRVLDPVLPDSTAVAEAWSGVTYVPSPEPGGGQILTGGWFRNPPGGADGFLALYGELDQPTPQRDATAVVRSVPNLRADWVFDHTVGPDGSIYAVGATSGSLEAGVLGGEGDAFIVRFDADLANPVYRQIATPYADVFREIEMAADGTIHVVGATHGDLDGVNADPDRLTGDVVVMSFDADLELLDTIQFGTPGDEWGAIALDGDDVVIGGMTEGAMAAPSAGAFDLYAVRLDQLA